MERGGREADAGGAPCEGLQHDGLEHLGEWLPACPTGTAPRLCRRGRCPREGGGGEAHRRNRIRVDRHGLAPRGRPSSAAWIANLRSADDRGRGKEKPGVNLTGGRARSSRPPRPTRREPP